MSDPVHKLSSQYCATLRRYLAQHDEVPLQDAYEFGRRAFARGMGVLDMARVHQQTLASCLSNSPATQSREWILRSAENFLVEMLSPFEAAHRGFREANRRLRQLNKALGHRNQQLATTNRKLAAEMSQRKRTERALRDGEEHYRHLFGEASRMQEKLRRLSDQILHAQEEERKRISRELHDEVGQALTAINIHLAMLQSKVSKSPELLRKQIGDTQNLVGQTMERVRRFARELRPDLLDELGLVPALRSCLKAFAERTGINVRFRASADAECLDDRQKTVVYRVTQESLTNVAKHARASQVTVTLSRLKNAVRVCVKDNGTAFAVARQLSSNGKNGLGLLGMQERARLVNGRFGITSIPGRGTSVSVEIPCTSPTPLSSADASRIV